MAQGGDLKSLFLSFAGYGTRSDQQELEGSKFKKLCTDCGLLDKKFTVTDVDLMFVKSKTKGSQKLTFPEFEKALELIAEKKGISLDDLKSKLTSASGPKTQATTPDYVKFHDDKSTYTGVYANGGPTSVDGKGDLSELCDRSDANVRGVTQKFANSH
ncbi:hypothetical protein WJX77_005720 [Trebouxia sp. C0004]